MSDRVAETTHCLSCPHYKPLQQLVLGPLTLDVGHHRVTWHGQLVPRLTAAEFRILLAMASRPGQHLSYRDVYDVIQKPGFHAGHGEAGYRNNVRSMIKRIRHKFRAVAPDFTALQNHMGVGYCWAPP